MLKQLKAITNIVINGSKSKQSKLLQNMKWFANKALDRCHRKPITTQSLIHTCPRRSSSRLLPGNNVDECAHCSPSRNIHVPLSAPSSPPEIIKAPRSVYIMTATMRVIRAACSVRQEEVISLGHDRGCHLTRPLDGFMKSCDRPRKDERGATGALGLLRAVMSCQFIILIDIGRRRLGCTTWEQLRGIVGDVDGFGAADQGTDLHVLKV